MYCSFHQSTSTFINCGIFVQNSRRRSCWRARNIVAHSSQIRFVSHNSSIRERRCVPSGSPFHAPSHDSTRIPASKTAEQAVRPESLHVSHLPPHSLIKRESRNRSSFLQAMLAPPFERFKAMRADSFANAFRRVQQSAMSFSASRSTVPSARLCPFKMS